MLGRRNQRRPTSPDDGPNAMDTQTAFSNEPLPSSEAGEGYGSWPGGKLSLPEKVPNVQDEVHNFPEIPSWTTAKWLK